ncbi:cytochrome P450 [Zopfochytrium polystomum]|nr:cytochrome P450 [Zopfochytrium polystomum]
MPLNNNNSNNVAVATAAGAAAAAVAGAIVASYLFRLLFPDPQEQEQERLPKKDTAGGKRKPGQKDEARFGNDLPVAGGALPVLGHALILADVAKYFPSLGYVFNVTLFNIKMVNISGADNLRWMALKGVGKFLSPAWPERWGFLMGSRAVSVIADPSDHKRLRALLSPGFSKQTISAYTTALHAEARATLRAMAAASRQGTSPINPYPFTQAFTFRVICGFVAGADPAHFEAFNACSKDFLVWSAGMGDLALPAWFYFGPFAAAMRARARMLKVFMEIVEERKLKMERDGAVYNDALGALLNSRDEDGGMLSNEEIGDNIVVLLFAGYDTTSGALSSLLHELTHNVSPTQLHHLRKEIAQLPDDPSEQALSECPYLDSLYKETLRVHSPIGGAMRTTTSEVEIEGRRLRTGTRIFAGLASTMKDSSVFESPLVFDMARWLPEGKGPGNADAAAASDRERAWTPYSVGPRMCLGMHLAKMEFKVFVFQLFRSFDVRASAIPSSSRHFPIISVMPRIYVKEKDSLLRL